MQTSKHITVKYNRQLNTSSCSMYYNINLACLIHVQTPYMAQCIIHAVRPTIYEKNSDKNFTTPATQILCLHLTSFNLSPALKGFSTAWYLFTANIVRVIEETIFEISAITTSLQVKVVLNSKK